MAIAYSGTGQYHLTSSTPVTAAPLTLACWFAVEIGTDIHILMSICDSASTNEHFAMDANGVAGGNPLRNLCEAAGLQSVVQTTTGYTSTQWHHGCARFTSSTDRDVFIDGGSQSTTSTTTRVPSSVDRIALGVLGNSSPTDLLTGRLAEVAIWDVALNTDEVAKLAKAYCPLLVRPDRLVFYAPLVREVQDVIGGLTLTATGTPTVANHPRIIYPARKRFSFPTAAAGGNAVPVAWKQYRQRRIA